MPAVYSSQQAVGTTPVLVAADQLRFGLVIRNLGPSTVWIGGATVSSANGFPLAVDQSVALGGTQWAGAGGEASAAVYAVSNGTATVAVLEVR